MSANEFVLRPMTKRERQLALRHYRAGMTYWGSRLEFVLQLGCLLPPLLLLSLILFFLALDLPNHKGPGWFAVGALAIIAGFVYAIWHDSRRLRIKSKPYLDLVARRQVEELVCHPKAAIKDQHFEAIAVYLLDLGGGQLLFLHPFSPHCNYDGKELARAEMTLVRLPGWHDLLTITSSGDEIPVRETDWNQEAPAWAEAIHLKRILSEAIIFPGNWQTAEDDFINYIQTHYAK